jgi:hypothetical protein
MVCIVEGGRAGEGYPLNSLDEGIIKVSPFSCDSPGMNVQAKFEAVK